MSTAAVKVLSSDSVVITVISALPTAVTDVIAWVVIALFVGGWILESRRRDYARDVTASAWVVFAGFWLLLVPRFAFVMRSPIETVLSALAVPACLSAGYLVWKGRDSLFVLSRGVAIMGIVYLPFEMIPILRETLIETVAHHTYATIGWLGYEVMLGEGPNGYQSALLFSHGGHQYKTHIVLACTGIGSMSIFAGLVAAIKAPLRRKLAAIGVAISVIYFLNIARNVFIAVAFGNQWFQILVEPVMVVTGYTDPGLVSFFIADRVMSQSLSVVALVGITWVVIRTVPEIISVLEEAIYVVTRTEYDLQAALAIDGNRG